MALDHTFEKRKLVIGGVAVAIVVIYLIRLFFLQVSSDDYKLRADSNAFRKEVMFPSRGLIYDRNGKLLVYNEPSYNILVTMQEQHGVDTLGFCSTIGITKEEYIKRMEDIKNPAKNPSYSRNTPQLFLSQVPAEIYAQFCEKQFRFNGFKGEQRSARRYTMGIGAHLLGDVGEVNQNDIDSSSFYAPGDYIGKLGVERSYERQLRGEKGIHIRLRDVRGRDKGPYENGRFDREAKPGRNITLSIDADLQALAERLLEGKLGAIVAIDPKTGEVLCMASGPSYDPRKLVGPERSATQMSLQNDPLKPLLNRAIMGCYPPGSTFKPTQGLIGLQEGIISPNVAFPCSRGFNYKGQHLGCHGHGSPISLVPALATSCNAYFCWNLLRMFNNRQKYPSQHDAMTRWKDHLVAMGYGYRLGVDLPGEKRGMIPNAEYYDKCYPRGWNALSVISISIGQGEVTATPLQIANLGATIANGGWFITPHLARSVQGERLSPEYTKKRHTLVDPRYYPVIAAGMRRAVLGGTCRGADIPGLEVCGKTGTAQNRGQDHSAFLGFAPMSNPRIAVAVYVENGGFGATFGVPLGALIIEQYLNGGLSPASQEKATAFQKRRISYGGYSR
ncbi:MAG: penicillin-binding protein 2 [Bacteroidaceae bacterium]|nr:penicillin-binding protein 2 [Bacteroidaceae bacterium]